MTGPAAVAGPVGVPGASTLSTHILDAVSGAPAAGVAVAVARRDGETWTTLDRATTDQDGRIAALVPEGMEAGVHRLLFDTAAYFRAAGRRAFYPEVSIVFEVGDERHYHLPLLLSPFAYSTYRGS
jgi:5-hydroxyisourate hydrolase